uniref:GRF-type domain-containing protein n=1 Tax=Oryza nivara TaxID=4536 RepID=A0A0E0J2I7_ORYNI
MNTAAASGGDGVAGVQLQEFAYFVVIDLEATCERGRRIYPQEIIEFASVVVDGATGEQLAEAFRAYVRPLHHRELTDYCRELTGIAQADVDAGVDLREALRAHDAWLDARGVKNAAGGGGGGGGFAVVTWGDWDCRTMLEGECRFKGIIGDGKPEYFDRWINLKVPFRQVFDRGGARRIGLEEALAVAGLAFEGRPHSGLDDARNTARLLALLMRRRGGVRLAITGSLPPPPRPPSQLVAIGASAAATPAAAAPGVGGGGARVHYCQCGVASRVGVARRPGPTQGRRFFGCGRWTPARGAVCSYFVWEDVDMSRPNPRP